MTFLMSRHLRQELYDDGIANNSRITRMVIDMTDAYRRSLETSVNHLSDVFASNFADGFVLDDASTATIDGQRTPQLRNGNKVLNLDFVAVDKFNAITGGIATVFARQGKDFVRITTSLKMEDGKRAVGSVLDEKHPRVRQGSRRGSVPWQSQAIWARLHDKIRADQGRQWSMHRNFVHWPRFHRKG